ncbi:MAG: DNA polymerase IV, partial [Flavobacterium sp.]
TGADLKKLSEQELIRYFGKSGKFYYSIVRGFDDREVQPFRQIKSLAAEDTFEHDLITIQEMYTELTRLAEKIVVRLEKRQLKGRTITLKLKYSDFSQITRSASLGYKVSDYDTILQTAKHLLENVPLNKSVRLLGISISNFYDIAGSEYRRGGPYQLQLFE